MMFFSLGTPLIISAGRGTAWFSATLTGGFFIALGLYLFRYSKKLSGRFAGLFFVVLATFSRWHFALLIPVMTFILLHEGTSTWLEALSPRNLFKKWKLLIPGLTFAALFFGWNYWRFGEVMNLHYREHGYGGYFQERIEAFGMTNIRYVLLHAYHGLFGAPKALPALPFFEFDKEGNGLFAMSPLFLFAIFRFPKITADLKVAVGMMLLLLIPVFTHFSMGWSQHGYRYALDFMPFLFLILVRTDFRVQSPLAITLILLSIWMNVTASLILNL